MGAHHSGVYIAVQQESRRPAGASISTPENAIFVAKRRVEDNRRRVEKVQFFRAAQGFRPPFLPDTRYG
jgi:hypothetical protein